jgi:YVTN family beta-propeller protein
MARKRIKLGRGWKNNRARDAMNLLSCRASGVFGVLLCGALASLPCSAATASHEIYVTNEISGDLTIIDGDSLAVEATVPLGRRPRGIEVSPDNTQLFIAFSGSPIQGPPGARTESQVNAAVDPTADGIGQFDIATRKVLRVIRGISDPEKLALSRDGRRLYVASEDSGTLVVMEVASGRVLAAPQVGAEPEGVRLTPDGRHVYVTSEAAHQVAILDTAANSVVGQVKVGARPRSVAFSPDGTKAYVPGEFDATVTVIDTRRRIATGTIQLDDKAARPMDVVVSANGSFLYVSTGRGRTVVEIDTAAARPVRAATVGARPWGLALSPDGRRIYVANGPSNDISVIDAVTFKVIASVRAGTGPWAIAVSSKSPATKKVLTNK